MRARLGIVVLSLQLAACASRPSCKAPEAVYALQQQRGAAAERNLEAAFQRALARGHLRPLNVPSARIPFDPERDAANDQGLRVLAKSPERDLLNGEWLLGGPEGST